MPEDRNGPAPPVSPAAAPRTAADLVTLIERRIADGELAPGSRLEPVRSVADTLHLAPNTVASAYRRLQRRGLLRGDGRRGTFVADRPAVGPGVAETVPAGVVDLATGNPDRRLLPDLGAPLRRIDPGHTLYGSPSIDGGLGAALAADLGADLGPLAGAGLEAGRSLAVVSGALDGIERTLDAHLRPGDAVVVEDPAYTSVIDLLRARGLRAVPVPVDPAGMVPDRLAAALARRVGAVIVTPRAQNPTGAAIDRARADALRAVLAGHPGVLVVEDDHAGAVAGQPYRGIVPEGAERWAVIRSMAKSLGPDLRVAGLAGDQVTVTRVIGRQLLGPGWVAHLLQRLAAELLGDPGTAAHLEAAGRRLRRAPPGLRERPGGPRHRRRGPLRSQRLGARRRRGPGGGRHAAPGLRRTGRRPPSAWPPGRRSGCRSPSTRPAPWPQRPGRWPPPSTAVRRPGRSDRTGVPTLGAGPSGVTGGGPLSSSQ